jgi:ribosome-binding factor A
MSQRLPRVRELIQRELGQLLTREMDFDGSLVSIHEVDITPDLKNCHVFIGVVGPRHAGSKALEKLAKHRIALQAKMARRVVLKHTPHLHFHLDESVERGVRTLQTLEEVEQLPTADPEPDQPPGGKGGPR